jgi:hypothetical protein
MLATNSSSTTSISTSTTATNVLSKATASSSSFTSLTNMIRNASNLSTAASVSTTSNGHQDSTATPLVDFKISLEVPLMTPDRLYPTPSMKDNLPYEVEFDLRLLGCELIQTSGRLLKLPQVSSFLLVVILFVFYSSSDSF